MPKINPPFHALTVKSHGGVLRQLVTTVHVFTAKEIINNFKIEKKEFQGQAIWDTGATTTAISSNVARGLNLIPIGKATVEAVNDRYEVNRYLVDIVLPNGVGLRSVEVTEATNLGQFDILIGMDIITKGDFVITNAGGETWFSFRIPPDGKKIDYVARANEIQAKQVRRKKSKAKRKR